MLVLVGLVSGQIGEVWPSWGQGRVLHGRFWASPGGGFRVTWDFSQWGSGKVLPIVLCNRNVLIVILI